MAVLRMIRLILLTATVMLAVVASSPAPVSAATYTMPMVAKLTSTMPASSVMPIDVHTLCHVRIDLQTYPDYEGRAVCYRTFGSDPPPTPSTITEFTIPANHVVLPVEDLGSGTARITFLPCTEVLPGALAVEITLDFQLSKSGLPTSGQTDLFVDDTAPFTCGGVPDATGAATITPLGPNHDEDRDGCTDWNELAPPPNSSDPFNPNDCGPKPGTDGDLSDIIDLNVRQGAPGGEEQFQCISRVDHDLMTNEMKSSTVCYINSAGMNSAGMGDLANVLLGRTVPCGDKAPPGTDNPPFCPDGSREGIDCTGGAPPLTDPDCAFEPSGDALIGPPPPPYTSLAPMKGIGFYDPAGTSPECQSAGAPCSAIRSCFADIGAGTLGPNLGILIITPNPLGSQSPIAKVKLSKGISNDECDNLSWTPSAPLYGGLQVTVTESSDTPLSYRGVDAACAADYKACDFDGDGCTDFDELSKPGTQPKGCGDDPWNPNDSNKTDFSGAYSIGIRVTRSASTPGYAGIYFNCLADINQTGDGKTDGDLTARAFCYTDSWLHVVNNLDSPGITGDGQAGGSPPFGEIDAVGAPEADWTRALHGTGDLDEDNDDTANDGCPSEAFGDVDSKHVELTGYVDNGDNTLKLRGCFDDEDASSSVGIVYVEMQVNKNTGRGTVDIWTWQSQANCTTGADWGSYLGTWDGVHPGSDPGCPCADPRGNFNDAQVQIVRQPGGDDRDTDQDGIPNAVELRDNGADCGLRDPFNPYDWYDVNQDGVIDLVNDILGVIDHFQPLAGGAPPYDIIFDRPPTMTGAIGHWNRGAPDGVIDMVNDILGVIDQFHPLPC